MNEFQKDVNSAIDCKVKKCKHNCSEYCTLDKISVGNDCSKENCTCCISYEEE